MTPMENNVIARTGRVQNWIDDPTSRLPVSCTVFVVEDSMEGENGIEASWRFVSHALRYGAGVAVHLSKLRPSGTDNGSGLVASGPVSFGKIYSCLNEQLRRGGVYKNGAVVLHLDISSLAPSHRAVVTLTQRLAQGNSCLGQLTNSRISE